MNFFHTVIDTLHNQRIFKKEDFPEKKNMNLFHTVIDTLHNERTYK